MAALQRAGPEDLQGEEDCPSRAFADLNPAVWYHPYTDYVISHGLMKGMDATTFGPYKSMTRAMMVTTLYRLAGGAPRERRFPLPGCGGPYVPMPKQWPGLQPTALPRASRLIPSPRTPP
ncbi:MAG: S-layer homology domain-containing protein [Oscillospiraceae bacterium]